MSLEKIDQTNTNLDFEEVPQIINISGVTWEGRQSIISKLKPNVPIQLVRDYNNPYDKNAIAVKLIDGTQLGWIPRHYASILAPEIDAGIDWTATIDEVVGSEEFIRGVAIKVCFS